MSGRRADRLAERVWEGADVGARVARVALSPLELAYRAIIAARGAMYDVGLLRTRATVLPAVSVGNLSVGGTGKTPIAAWVAAELRARGGRPAVILRGYGDDEPLVHATLNPAIPVVIAPDRVAGIAEARVGGADVVVLDDAFQHRRAARRADIVLVSADSWPRGRRLLPAGPFREPLRALRRAAFVIVTRKAASLDDARRVVAVLAANAPGVPVGVVSLQPLDLREAQGPAATPLDRLAGAKVHAIAAIADPRAFLAQLHQAGAASVTASTFPDHHAFTAQEGIRLALAARDADVVVCTLKDAVKLAPHWPREAPRLWYVSQRVTVEHEREALLALLDGVLAARSQS